MADQLRREFTITRIFNAPRDLVFDAWTRPEHLTKWWGPRGFTTPEDSIDVDLRPGGRLRLTMVDDRDGTEYPVDLAVQELEPPTRLVLSWGDTENPLPQAGSGIATVTFAAVGEKTEMTFHQTAVNTEEHHRNAETGWSQSFDRFGEELVPCVGSCLALEAPRQAPRSVVGDSHDAPASRQPLRLAMHSPGHLHHSNNLRRRALEGE